MKKLVYVPVESLNERYTQQWRDHFPTIFESAGFEVITIDGTPLRDFVKVGTFLDITSTIHYKASQMQAIAKLFDEDKIRDGDTFFFGDVEFWGIESVRLMAQMMNVDVKITGFLHAASYTIGDAFEVAAPYQQFTEVGWLAALDVVFVGSEYHKQAIVNRRLKPLKQDGDGDLTSRIVVSGNPMFKEVYPTFIDVAKRNQIVLTNRFDAEKDVGVTLRFFREFKAQYPDTNLVITTGRKTLRSNAPTLELAARNLARDGIVEIREGLTKLEYHRTLAESLVMISHSPEENFGYCIAEAALYNCQPLLLRGASHPEMVGHTDRYLFESTHDSGGDHGAVAKARRLLDNPSPTAYLAEPFFYKPIRTILDHL